MATSNESPGLGSGGHLLDDLSSALKNLLTELNSKLAILRVQNETLQNEIVQIRQEADAQQKEVGQIQQDLKIITEALTRVRALIEATDGVAGASRGTSGIWHRAWHRLFSVLP